ncbi:FkbM family methyltransferase [Phenylobacterium sp.]|uniref:FkbM family methyltransferase n=1 Tax=Phenylobacterium sp. TaxID=1871053 RepID=UPI00391B2A22
MDVPSYDVVRRLIDLYGTAYRELSDVRTRTRLADCGRLLIFGAGQNGRMVLGLLRAAGLEPAAFLDDTPSKAGAQIDGVPVLKVDEAGGMTDALAVVSIFSPRVGYLTIAERLSKLGVEPLSLFAVMWALGNAGLPFYFLDRPEAVTEASGSLAWLSARLLDRQSHDLLAAQVEFRLALRHQALPPWRADREAPPADWSRVFVIDAGAFDGDTLVPMLEADGPRIAGAIGLEPDPETFARLEANLAPFHGRVPAVRAIRAAAADAAGRRTFANAGNPGSSFAEAGIEVDAVTVDDLAADAPADARLYIKYDVEGAEAEALRGSARTIADRRPFLSIAAYHRPDDLWTLARIVAEIEPGYRFRLRSHGADGADLNLYATPPG